LTGIGIGAIISSGSVVCAQLYMLWMLFGHHSKKVVPSIERAHSAVIGVVIVLTLEFATTLYDLNVTGSHFPLPVRLPVLVIGSVLMLRGIHDLESREAFAAEAKSDLETAKILASQKTDELKQAIVANTEITIVAADKADAAAVKADRAVVASALISEQLAVTVDHTANDTNRIVHKIDDKVPDTRPG
jgi:hypothetical protein